MRQLWTTGWMHNRVRMVVGSFLVKHLLLPWQDGARWFFDTLIDADLASNTMGWQWTAGSGADAAPYFRIFHPVTQGERFDPEGIYIRKWVPELKNVPAHLIHEPWKMSLLEQSFYEVMIGKDYPFPIVDIEETRKTASEKVWSFRKTKEVKTEALRIVKKHVNENRAPNASTKVKKNETAKKK